MKRKLLLLLCALLTMIGVQQVKAYTVSDLTSAGWTPVSSLDDITSNVYMFLDANSSTYAVEGSSTTGRATFKVLGNPFADLSEVWTVEKRSGGYAIRNAESQYYFNSGPNGWDSFNAATYESGTFTFTLNGTKYDIKSTTTNEYVGPWNSATEVTPSDLGVAANKGTSMGFYIYKMAKATYALKYLQQCPNVASPVDMTYLIVNPTIYSATQATSSSRAVGSNVAIGETGWTAWKSLRNNNNYTAGSGNTVLEAWSAGWKMNIDYYQSIASLPSGKYSVTANAHFTKNSEDGDARIYVYNSVSGKEDYYSDPITVESADFSTKYIDVANGSINMGVETPEEITQSGSTALYLTADNFRLSADPYISTMATELPDGGAMTAGLWYSFSVEATGNYDLSGSSALNDIIYTTGSTTALKDAGSTKFTAKMTLTAGVTYYLRSSSDNTFSAVPDIATASQELPNSAVTVGDWFRFTTGSSSDAYVLSSTGNATVAYTIDGTIFSNADITDTWTLTNKLNILLAPSTTYYIKSNAAVTLTKTETSVSSSFVTGWTKVTSCEQLANNPKDYFFAIFSANNTGLYLINRNEANNEKLRYVTAGDPLRNGASLFEVENFDGDFVLKSAVNGKYFENRPVDGQDRPGIGEEDGPWNYHADLTEKDENCRTTLSFHDGVCTIQDKNDHNGNRYIGLWYVDHGYINLEILAGNKSEAEKASFIIYRIPKEECDLTYLIQDADCKSNDHWEGGSDGGRTFNEMVAFDGENRNVFSANNTYATTSKNGQRHQAITLPATGAYKLAVFCKVPGTNSNGYAQIWVDDLGNYIDYANARHLYTVDTDGNKTGTINTKGSEWFANEIYFTANAGDSKTIYINLSPGDMSTSRRYELAYVSGMKLTYLGTAPEISFDEAIVNPVVEVAHANVTIARNMKSDRWNTFTVPFSMAIPDGWTVKELTGVDYNESTSNYSLNFEEASSIVAGKAYMVKPGSDITEVNADDVTINTTTVIPSVVSDGDYTANFVGNNSYLAVVPWGSYIISNNVFYAVDTDIIQKGFRAYITVGGPSSARSTVSYDTEGGVTDIQNVVVNGLDKSGAQKDGKYFENNKIVIVKNGIKYGSNGQKLN